MPRLEAAVLYGATDAWPVNAAFLCRARSCAHGLDPESGGPPHVTSSIWEESLESWDDGRALARSKAPLLYLDAGTANADLSRALRLRPDLVIGRTIGSGHFSPLEVPDQVNAIVERFLVIAVEG